MMVKRLVVEYAKFEDVEISALAVVDESNDTVLNMFTDEAADSMYNKLITVESEEV